MRRPRRSQSYVYAAKMSSDWSTTSDELKGQGWGYQMAIHIPQVYFYLTYPTNFSQLEAMV
jgi:hypothetical protein